MPMESRTASASPSGRRWRPAWVACLALFAAAAAACGERRPGMSPEGPPNVVLIVMDTTRADRCGFQGYERDTTPRLAELAAEGTVFVDCWSSAPWTAPAHASLFTGLRAPRHGLTQASTHLPPTASVLAERLRDAGWQTGCFSANTYITPAFGLTQGFQRAEAPSVRLGLAAPTAAATHDAAAAWAIEAHAKGKPYFLFVNDMEPHAPYAPGEDAALRLAHGHAPEDVAAARFEHPRSIAYSVGALRLGVDAMAAASDLYDAEIATLDAEIGRLLDRLREAGALGNTLVVVTGDHGENLGDHGLSGHVFSLHRTLLHVPLLIWYPYSVPEGRVVEDTVRLEDLFPTVLEMCGLAIPPGIDGISLLGDLPGRVARATYERPAASIAHARMLAKDVDLGSFDVALRSVYDGRHHLIRASDGREWLYDVEDDPLEHDDLSREEPEIGDRLRALMDE